MAEKVQFGSRAEANRIRDRYGIDGDRRRTTVDLRGADLSPREEMAVLGAAAESRQERQTAGRAALTEEEKRRLDFSQIPYFSAEAAKAQFQSQGVEDWISVLDQSLEYGENVGLVGPEAQRDIPGLIESMGGAATVGRTAQRDPEGSVGGGHGISETTDEQLGRVPEYEAGYEHHAVKGARRGSADAKAALRDMGWSEAEIQEIVATGQERAALTPGETVVLSNGLATTPETWAKAKRSHEHRRVQSQHSDEGKHAPMTTDYAEWRADMDRLDFPGVDTVDPLASFFEDEDRYEAFHGTVSGLWKWQKGSTQP